ncbi:hypothetical protein OESDEN_01679 [Oesophagostomum dentatum]|uniref:Uncharacterized protein n=1 Tax=Oesophagostomum dentatum TaxID=61180 RepID=A0A0B1TSE8_OESDE|nr:hypothetical protein OESDEN_01679 [Oesophagostomum dentatum]
MLLSSEPKFKLSKKSQQKLASLCEEILAGNPMTWFTEDLKILWKQIHGGTIQNVASSSNYAEFVKKEMIPVTNNGRILQRKNQARFKSLQRRILELLQYDFVITIGDKNDVTEVVSCLPKEIGDISAYEGRP